MMTRQVPKLAVAALVALVLTLLFSVGVWWAAAPSRPSPEVTGFVSGLQSRAGILRARVGAPEDGLLEQLTRLVNDRRREQVVRLLIGSLIAFVASTAAVWGALVVIERRHTLPRRKGPDASLAMWSVGGVA